MIIVTGHTGKNADMIASAASLYVPDGAVVADVTYGLGSFWAKTPVDRFELLASDMYPRNRNVKKKDFRNLDYKSGSVDVVVLDPPYSHNPGRRKTAHITDHRYNNAKTDLDWSKENDLLRGMYHHDIINMYEQGMREARRILHKGGTLWVKCKDEISGGKQCWSHIEIFELATMILEMYAKDLFVIVPSSRTPEQWSRQLHARKTHSYLWIFEKR